MMPTIDQPKAVVPKTTTGTVTTLAYIGMTPTWAFRSPTVRQGGIKARRKAAQAALEEAATIAALPSALDPFSALRNNPGHVDDKDLERLTRLASLHAGGWIRFSRADGADAIGEDNITFASRHIRLVGSSNRYGRIRGPRVAVSYDEASLAFSVDGTPIDPIQLMRQSGVPVGHDRMHYCGDPLCIQVAALATAATQNRDSDTLDDLRRHIDGLRDRENGAASRGVAMDLQAYDMLNGRSRDDTSWTTAIRTTLTLVKTAWPTIVATAATIGLCSAIDSAVSIFAKVGESELADMEARETYESALALLAGDSVVRSAYEAPDLAHVEFDHDDSADLAMRRAIDLFLNAAARRQVHDVAADGARVSFYETEDARYLILERTDTSVVACWANAPYLPAGASLH